MADHGFGRVAAMRQAGQIDGSRFTPPLESDLGPRPRPILGDHVTLFTVYEAARYLLLSPNTLRRLRARGEIADEYFTEVGGRPGRPARLCMTGHQIAALVAWWTSRTAPAPEPEPEPVRRRRRAVAS